MANGTSYTIYIKHEHDLKESTTSKSDADKTKTRPSQTDKGGGDGDDDFYKKFAKFTTNTQKAVKNPLGTAIMAVGKGSVAVLAAAVLWKVTMSVLQKSADLLQLYTGDNQFAMGVRNVNGVVSAVFNPIGTIFNLVERQGRINRNNLEVEQRQIAVGTKPNGKGGYTI